MRKREELAGPSCWTNALDDERMFILLARDPAAPAAIRVWCNERVRLGLNRIEDDKIVEALACADAMEREREETRALAARRDLVDTVERDRAELERPHVSLMSARDKGRDRYLEDRFDTTDEHKGNK